MKDDEWHSGPPPSVGWWPASALQDDGVYRWWNGECWSKLAEECDSSRQAGIWAAQRSNFRNCDIYWKRRPDNWPERSKT